jgi:hypothetical protein
MIALRNVARELVEKRLWPVAALLVVGLIAIPVLFLRPAPAALEASTSSTPTTTGAPAPTAAPAAAAAAAPTGPTSASDVAADPSVAMTSSPFAAAFGSGLDLPPSMEGLLKATKGADESKAIRDAALRDPFAFAASTSTDASTATPPTNAPAMTSTPPASTTATPASTTPAANPLAGAGASSTPAPTAPPAGPDTAPVPDTTASGPTAEAAAKGITFHADVQFGTTGDSSPVASDAQRLTAFPSAFDPVAIYLGVMRGGWGAAFALRDDVRPVGQPACRPRKQICSWVILHIGESITLTAKDDATGAVTTYTLKLAAIKREDLAAEEAKAANARADVNGRCLLGPLAAYKYDTETGTLAARPELKKCQYRTPGQPETASVRTAHIG